MSKHLRHLLRLSTAALVVAVASISLPYAATSAGAQAQDVENPQAGSIGVEGTVPGDPPTTGATISFPRDGSTISDLPVTVTGICPTGLLVKLFKNNVFAGSTQCINGSFSIQTDLFGGRNELVARVYDALDQAGPDSNIVVVNFPFSQFGVSQRISLTSSFSKRGANPGQTLTWPITLSGGNGPYAVSADWGGGKPADIISQQFAGTFDISHVYDTPGIYNLIIRATDKDGNIAFLQLVAVANGPLSQTNQDGQESDQAADTQIITRILWQPAAASILLLFVAFWLGRRYELFILRRRLERRETIK